MDDELKVKEVNSQFYRALSTQDLEEMDVVWLHDVWARCVHPGWQILVGWEAIRESWANIFSNTEYLKVAVSNVSVEVRDRVAWVVCTENIATAHDTNYQTATAQATNIFYKVDDQWLLVHHHASPTSAASVLEASETIQ